MNATIFPVLPFRKYYTKNVKLFGFMNHRFYSDITNDLIIETYLEILRKCDALPLNAALPCAEKLVKEFNDSSKKEFKKLGKRLGLVLKPFFTLNVHPNKDGKKPFLFGYYLNKKEFLNFINAFSDSDKLTLYQKYKYIELTKFYGAELSSATIFFLQSQNYTIANDPLERFRSSFNIATKTEKAFILNTLDGILAFLKKKHDNFKKAYSTSSTLRFLPEFIVGVYTIRNLVENGYISTCYREMRSQIERLSWFTLNDYLSANSYKYWKIKAKEMPSLILNTNPQWYDSSENIGGMIRGLNDLIPKELQSNKNFKSKIKKELIAKMSMEMYIVLFGVPTNSITKYKNVRIFAPHMRKKLINKGIEEIRQCLINFKSRNPKYTTEADEFMAYIEKKWELFKYGVPKFPTTNFIFQFLKSAFGGKDWEGLQSLWHRYSLFVHPYLPTLQIIPNFSVIEYKVLKHEIPTFESVMKLEIDSLFEYFQKLRGDYDK